MYLLFPEMSQLSTEDDSLDCRGGGRGGGEWERGGGEAWPMLHRLVQAPDHPHDVQREKARCPGPLPASKDEPIVKVGLGQDLG